MKYFKRLTKLKEKSKVLHVEKDDKIVFFSDCHRGDGSFKDSLYPNRNMYLMALRYYYKNNYTYVEVGDGDELWKFKNIEDIYDAHQDEYGVLNDFKKANRFHMIYGNHDIIKSKKSFRKQIDKLKNKKHKLYKFYNDLDITESLVIKFKESKEYFAFHGHQVDFINYELAPVSKFLVRYVWGFLNGVMSFKEVTSPAESQNKRDKVDKRIMKWSNATNSSVVVGHTHKTMFPEKSDIQYFNIGACVLPYIITCIEIKNGAICLMKWIIEPVDNGLLAVRKEYIGNPREL